MPQKLVNGILIEGDPLAPHPGAFVSDTLLRGPSVGIKLHDYLWVVLNHGWYKLSPLPPGNFLLKLSILSVPQLDSPLLEEWPAFNGLKLSLVFLTPKPVPIKLHVHLWGRTRTLYSGIFSWSLGWKLLWSYFLWGYICKVSLHGISIITIKAKQTKIVHASFYQTQTSMRNLENTYTLMHGLFFMIYTFIYMYIHIFGERHFITYIHTYTYTHFFKSIFYATFPTYIHTIERYLLFHLSNIYTLYWKVFFMLPIQHIYTLLRGIFLMLPIHTFCKAFSNYLGARHLPWCNKFEC